MVPPFRILIVDTSRAAREHLRILLEESRYPVEVVEMECGREALTEITKHRPQLVLLDIPMPGTNGLDLGRQVATISPRPQLVYVTATDRYALKAFEVGARDYLLKPVQAAALERALERTLGPQPAMPEATSSTPVHRSHILVSAKGAEQMVPLAEIFYFKADSKYVTIRTELGTHLVNEALKTLEVELDSEFFRIHRNALVCKNRIAGLERGSKGGWSIFFHNIEDRLTVSRRYKPTLRRWLLAQR